MYNPNAKAIHICNSHRLSHRPKIAKDYVFPTHKPTQKNQKSLLLPTHPSPPTTLTKYEWISREKRADNDIKF